MAVVKIEAYEGAWLLPLVQRAQENLGEHARIVKVVADRGYLDGEDLWAPDQQGIVFVVVAKDRMHVRADAQALARTEPSVERRRAVRHGHGRTARTETRVTRLVGTRLRRASYDAYGTAEHASQANRADFQGNPLNAVVVLTWDNRAYPDGGTVYLTNGPVDDPFVVFDDADWRSVLALCTAFRLQQAREAAEAEPPSKRAARADRAGQAAATVELSSVLLGGEGTDPPQADAG